MPLRKGERVYVINEDNKPEEVTYRSSHDTVGGCAIHRFTDDNGHDRWLRDDQFQRKKRNIMRDILDQLEEDK